MDILMVGQIFHLIFSKTSTTICKGLNQHTDSTQVYVNKGTGFWGPPMRLGASAEITILKLSFKFLFCKIKMNLKLKSINTHQNNIIDFILYCSFPLKSPFKEGVFTPSLFYCNCFFFSIIIF